MVSLFRIIIAVILVSLITGCKWRDDFRERQQPQYLEQSDRPTLNRDSLDYKGDDTHKAQEDEKATALPSIDGLSPIPEVPEYPSGVNPR